MLNTAKSHFDNDIVRAKELCKHASQQAASVLQGDISRAAWMMAVGASDAYFCDAYADLIARTLQAKQIESAVEIPDRLCKLKVPVIAVIRSSQDGWRWRMAARELIEDESVLSLEKIKALFNHFFRKSHKLFNDATLELWILHPDSRSRRFGITPTQYRNLPNSSKATARAGALVHFEDYYDELFQRRHDCIHNCDRPKNALQSITHTKVDKVIEDMAFLVGCCHASFLDEFPRYLTALGFSSITRNKVLQ
jgi:hypothetical protein